MLKLDVFKCCQESFDYLLVNLTKKSCHILMFYQEALGLPVLAAWPCSLNAYSQSVVLGFALIWE